MFHKNKINHWENLSSWQPNHDVCARVDGILNMALHDFAASTNGFITLGTIDSCVALGWNIFLELQSIYQLKDTKSLHHSQGSE